MHECEEEEEEAKNWNIFYIFYFVILTRASAAGQHSKHKDAIGRTKPGDGDRVMTEVGDTRSNGCADGDTLYFVLPSRPPGRAHSCSRRAHCKRTLGVSARRHAHFEF